MSKTANKLHKKCPLSQFSSKSASEWFISSTDSKLIQKFEFSDREFGRGHAERS